MGRARSSKSTNITRSSTSTSMAAERFRPGSSRSRRRTSPRRRKPRANEQPRPRPKKPSPSRLHFSRAAFSNRKSVEEGRRSLRPPPRRRRHCDPHRLRANARRSCHIESSLSSRRLRGRRFVCDGCRISGRYAEKPVRGDGLGRNEPCPSQSQAHCQTSCARQPPEYKVFV